jgi:hypothetical protein
MRRVLLLASAVGLIVAAPAVAQGGTLRGVVIAKEAKRHTVVIADRNGTVSTLRAGKSAGKARIGRLLEARVAKLPDGTYSAGALRPLGKAKHIHVKGVVIKRQGARLVLSAGHSVFVVRLRAAKRSSSNDGALGPGDEVDVNADVGSGGLAADEQNVKATGHTDKLELEGIYLSTTGNVLDVAIVHRGLVHVSVPDGLSLPTLSAGDQVALVVSLNADSSFSLVSIETEESADSGGDGVHIDKEHSEFTVVGILSALSDTSVSVKVERHPEPVTCAITPGSSLTGKSFPGTPLAIGDLVEMRCKYVDGKSVLIGLRSKQTPNPDDGTGKLKVSGFIAAFDSSSVSVRVEGRPEPVTCLLPAGSDMLGFAVGDFVDMYCMYDGSHWVLKGLYSDHGALSVDEGKAWFGLSGVIVEVNSARISVQVEHHPGYVTCAMPAGMDTEGFAVGEAVRLYCQNLGDGFKVKALRSDRAAINEDGSAWFYLNGTIAGLSSSDIGLTAEHHSSPVTCAVPAGADLSAFASGEAAVMKCLYHDGQFVLAALKTEHASIVLEP